MPFSTFAPPPTSAHDAIAESNHRIANNLTLVASMVRLHARTVLRDDSDMPVVQVRSLLEEIGGRIDQIAHLHGLLAKADPGAPVDLCAYLREIAKTVVSSLTIGGNAHLTDASARECRVVPERALTIGLITGELVTNAVKYSHPAGINGEISVGCRSEAGTIVVEVSDDGVGLPEGFDPMRNGGLGMRLVRSLADQLKARLVFDNTGIGLSVQVHMPEIYPVQAGVSISPPSVSPP
jgi:two-component sensor histidine kinase